MSAQGADYSSWQASMDLTGLSFVIIRATLGTGSVTVTGLGGLSNGVDARFAQFWKQAAPVHRGAYHFFYPSLDPVVQADLFVATVKAAGLRPGDMLYCDSETYADNVDAATKAFCDRVKSQVPASNPVGVYANHDIGQHLVKTAAAYPDTYWFAYPASAAPAAWLLAPWKQWRFWQWGQRSVDQDAYNGSPADLDAWLATYTGETMALDDADVGLIWAKEFSEYIDEGGDGTLTARRVSDILFSAHRNTVQLKQAVAGLTAAVAALQAKAGDPVDETALAAALAPVIQAAINAAGQADAESIAGAVAAVFAAKLGA